MTLPLYSPVGPVGLFVPSAHTVRTLAPSRTASRIRQRRVLVITQFLIERRAGLAGFFGRNPKGGPPTPRGRGLQKGEGPGGFSGGNWNLKFHPRPWRGLEVPRTRGAWLRDSGLTARSRGNQKFI